MQNWSAVGKTSRYACNVGHQGHATNLVGGEENVLVQIENGLRFDVGKRVKPAAQILQRTTRDSLT